MVVSPSTDIVTFSPHQLVLLSSSIVLHSLWKGYLGYNFRPSATMQWRELRQWSVEEDTTHAVLLHWPSCTTTSLSLWSLSIAGPGEPVTWRHCFHSHLWASVIIIDYGYSNRVYNISATQSYSLLLEYFKLHVHVHFPRKMSPLSLLLPLPSVGRYHWLLLTGICGQFYFPALIQLIKCILPM